MEVKFFRSWRGFVVGETVQISCEAQEVQVRGVTATRVLLDWPWGEPDPASENFWDGTLGLPRDPTSYDWRNIPWRVDPDTDSLTAGDICIVGIPPVEAVVRKIANYIPAADFGRLPRPEWALELCYPEYLDDEEAGFTIYLDSAEPVQIEVVG
ncbi:hypothetical protein E1264_37725 [Actinomadura sp. KC216]|uniref:hypothetical protein n=1 Tax=Actinomadura sp. KC216 TaxID=2530370 RepID=UPI00104D2279|nr:hypothetical protein [Actinomadura sp. KC216]TDB77120.1 hypothetical protein E1264_37725 [Actinomadura sp. KC216]